MEECGTAMQLQIGNTVIKKHILSILKIILSNNIIIQYYFILYLKLILYFYI